jgi:hypothetical protein
MKHLRVVVLLLLLVILTSAQTGGTQSGCGIKPLKPLIPLGCKDLVAQCKCDAKGQNCKWEWICVPR